jgi:hypothetical protein
MQWGNPQITPAILASFSLIHSGKTSEMKWEIKSNQIKSKFDSKCRIQSKVARPGQPNVCFGILWDFTATLGVETGLRKRVPV